MRSSCFPPIQDGDGIGFGTVMGPYFDDNDLTPFFPSNTVLHFGSAHAAGVNAVFADGSVRGFSYDIDVVVFNALGSRNGEEAIPEDGSI
jgi:prepilin-type processing-associated H-X9-DG protein